jgi:hypothetical protein
VTLGAPTPLFFSQKKNLFTPLLPPFFYFCNNSMRNHRIVGDRNGGENDNTIISFSTEQEQGQQEPPATTTPASASGAGAAVAAQVLTMEAIALLSISHLDAGDVLEVYYLARTTRLASPLDHIPMTKATLGLRYRSTAARPKPPQELTLEWGARRTANDTETIPTIIHYAPEQQQDHGGASIAWDNTARIYYRESIDNTIYQSATYLASISGNVVNKLLVSAVDYANRKRYQPWTIVFSNATNPATADTSTSTSSTGTEQQQLQQRVLLKSMRDTDFLSYCINTLASLGVQLRPVITPIIKSLQLHASSITKIPDDGRPAVLEFYTKLYDCLGSIANADYTKYNTNNHPPPTLPPSTHAPTTAPTTTTTTIPPSTTRRMTPTTVTANPVTFPPLHHHGHRRQRRRRRTLDNSNGTLISTTTHTPSSSPHPSLNPTTIQHLADASMAEQQQAAATVVINYQASSMAQAALLSNDANTAATIIRTCFTDARFGMPMTMPTTTNSSTTSTTTTITNATSSTTSPLNNNSNRTGTVTSYIYWDGSHWYQVELVPPYISVGTATLQIPTPPIAHFIREDLVDYTIVLIILIITLFGTLLLLQQVLGRSISYQLYRYQRWFFHPTHYSLDDDDMVDFSDRKLLTAYQFGQEVIPLSMGGQLLRKQLSMELQDQPDCNNSNHNDTNNINACYSGISYIDDNDELEMVETSSVNRTVSPLPNILPSFGRALSLPTHESDSCGELAPHRLFRDPSLVDLPNLSTLNTKIAVPVSGNDVVINNTASFG